MYFGLFACFVNIAFYQTEVTSDDLAKSVSPHQGHSLVRVKPKLCETVSKNIARGTTDPEIDSVTWTKFSDHMAALALVANLATR